MAQSSDETHTRPIAFSKLQAAQNDFVAIDNRDEKIQMTNEQRRHMCHRHLGIGADGVMEIHHSRVADFKILHFNPDGTSSSLCGNGLRCAMVFCKNIGIPMRDITAVSGSMTDQLEAHLKDAANCEIQREITSYGFPKSCYLFEAFDGVHVGVMSHVDNECFVRFRRVEFRDIKTFPNGDTYVDTGSPHHVKFLTSVGDVDVVKDGRRIRHGVYGEAGSNVNFVSDEWLESLSDTVLHVRTYERFVEAETKACGTGAVAVAIADVMRKIQVELGSPSEDNSNLCDSKNSHTPGMTGMKNMTPGMTGMKNMTPGRTGMKNLETTGKPHTKIIQMVGGILRVYFQLDKGGIDSIWLRGPAVCVMEGRYLQ